MTQATTPVSTILGMTTFTFAERIVMMLITGIILFFALKAVKVLRSDKKARLLASIVASVVMFLLNFITTTVGRTILFVWNNLILLGVTLVILAVAFLWLRRKIRRRGKEKGAVPQDQAASSVTETAPPAV